MKTLLISGNTLTEWNVEEIISNVKSKDQIICDMIQTDWDNTISRCGMTYLEIEQLNTYN
jgi:hypothetical protein